MSEPETIAQRRDRAAQRAFKSALAEAEATMEPVDLTEADKRNGWTVETLTQYHAEQRASQALKMDPTGVGRRKPMPRLANSKYRPHHWRGRG